MKFSSFHPNSLLKDVSAHEIQLVVYIWVKMYGDFDGCYGREHKDTEGLNEPQAMAWMGTM